MTTEYRTRQGDVFDDIVWRHYATQSDRVVERALEANPHIDAAAVLPAGLIVTLPPLEISTPIEEVQLWS